MLAASSPVHEVRLAVTPDPSEAFVREVDENLRLDQQREFARKHGNKIIAAMVLLLAAIGGYMYWQNRQQAQSAKDSETLSAVMTDIGAGNVDGVENRLKPLEGSASEGIAAQAKLTRAAVSLQKGDRATAVGLYRDLAGDRSLARPYRDLATVRLAALEFDTIKPDEVISRLEDLAKPGNPWFGSAGELTAMALLKQNKKAEAGKLFAAIAADKTVPDTLRSRAVQIAGTLGVDATASLPNLPR